MMGCASTVATEAVLCLYMSPGGDSKRGNTGQYRGWTMDGAENTYPPAFKQDPKGLKTLLK